MTTESRLYGMRPMGHALDIPLKLDIEFENRHTLLIIM